MAPFMINRMHLKDRKGLPNNPIALKRNASVTYVLYNLLKELCLKGKQYFAIKIQSKV